MIAHDAKVSAARAQDASVELDVAWKEWQTAEAAKTAAYDVIALDAALTTEKEEDARQAQSLALVRHAYDRNERKVPDLTAAQAAANDAHAAVLGGEHDLKHQLSIAQRAIGLQPGSAIALRRDIPLPSRLVPPPAEQLLAGLEEPPPRSGFAREGVSERRRDASRRDPGAVSKAKPRRHRRPRHQRRQDDRPGNFCSICRSLIATRATSPAKTPRARSSSMSTPIASLKRAGISSAQSKTSNRPTPRSPMQRPASPRSESSSRSTAAL